MVRLRHVWPFNVIKTEYVLLVLPEILLVAFIWRYYLWGLGYKAISLALTMLLALPVLYFNGAIFSLLKEWRKKRRHDPKAKRKAKHHHATHHGKRAEAKTDSSISHHSG